MGYASHSVENIGEPFLFADEMVFYIPKGGRVKIKKSQFKFIFVLQGDVLHEIDGLVGTRPLKTGDILVCPAFKYHTYINPNVDKVCQLHVMRLFIDEQAKRKRVAKRVKKPEFDLGDYVFHHFTRTVQYTDGIDSEVAGYLNALRRETEQHGSGYRHRARSLCTDLVIATSRKTQAFDERGKRSGSGGSSYLVASAKEYVLKNLDAHLTLGGIAWHVGKGEEHLARVFKKETGQSVFDYVREMRVNHAKTQLLDPSLSLSQIAVACGFSSLSFFSRTFRKYVGISPSAYRSRTEVSMMPHSAERSEPLGNFDAFTLE